MSQRSPSQEADIDAAIAHVDFLLQARRASKHYDESYKAAIRLAVVKAATAIVDEPKGHQVRTAFDALVRMPPALRLVHSK
jgi:hypothetical protein